MTEREPYEKPEAEEVSVEELLTQAQEAVDAVFEKHRQIDSKSDDVDAALSEIAEQLEDLEGRMAEAERAVQRFSYVAKVKGEHDGTSDGS